MRKRVKIGIVLLIIAFYISIKWDDLPGVQAAVHGALDPSLGALVNYNVWLGLIVITGIVTLLLTLAQKYLTNQEELKELKKEQKEIQKLMKEHRKNGDKEKEFELQGDILQITNKMLKHSMGTMLYTFLPIVLLFRWFGDTLEPHFGGWWILYYLIAAVFFSSIYRKWLNVA